MVYFSNITLFTPSSFDIMVVQKGWWKGQDSMHERHTNFARVFWQPRGTLTATLRSGIIEGLEFCEFCKLVLFVGLTLDFICCVPIHS